MLEVSPEKLLVFAKTLEGQEPQTLHQKKTFTVEVKGDCFFFTAKSTLKKPRLHNGKYLQAVCDKFSEKKSYHPSEYHDLTYDASYILAIIRRYVDSGSHSGA
jgi:hypothetical protein